MGGCFGAKSKNLSNLSSSPDKKGGMSQKPDQLKGIQLSDLDIEKTELLVSGGFGDVVKIPLKSGKDVLAVKIMSVNSLSQQDLEEMQKEMKLLEKISDQIIKPRCFPKYYGFFLENKRGNNLVYNICFKYHPYTLRSYLKELQESQIAMDAVRILHFTSTLINGLAYLQLLGICHRDLKPENILLDAAKENLTIIDFGAAKNILSQTLKSSTKMNVTIIGTKPYASPEMLKGLSQANEETQTGGLGISTGGTSLLQVNPYKSDVFSLGLIIMELLKSKNIRNRLTQTEYDLKIGEVEEQLKNVKINEQQKRKFGILIKILAKSLKVEPNDRWDFLRIFKEHLDIYDSKKMRLHLTITLCSHEKKIEEFFKNCNFFFFFKDF